MNNNPKSSRKTSAARPMGIRGMGLVVVVLLTLGAVACFSPRSGGEPAPNLGGPEYSALVVSSDLARGPNRLVFTLVNRDNVPVDAEQAVVTAMYTPPGASEPESRGTFTATFLPWPPEGSKRGVFVTTIDFEVAGDATRESPGLWELGINATAANGAVVEAVTAVRVAESPATPPIGSPAPRSVTPVAGEAAEISHISSAPNPDPELYRLSVHEALDGGIPLMVVFSTPAFCVSATCGPQLEIMGQLKERYRDRANFIHVEVFEDPHLIQGDRFTAKQVPAVAEWGLPTEPWTFIIDSEGLISSKFEQFTPEEVLEAALKETL